MRACLVLPLALTLLATSLPALSSNIYQAPYLSNRTSRIAIYDEVTQKIVPGELRQEHIIDLYEAVISLRDKQSIDKKTIEELTQKIAKLENANVNLNEKLSKLSEKTK